MRTAQEILTEFQMVHRFDPALAGQRTEQELIELLNKARGKTGATAEESVQAAETIAGSPAWRGRGMAPERARLYTVPRSQVQGSSRFGATQGSK